jgi:hypothetical protein
MASAKPQSIDELNPWSRWGIALSSRDGRPVLTETALWFLELRHPETIERDGADLYLHLDRAYQVVKQRDRARFRLEPAPFRTRNQASG